MRARVYLLCVIVIAALGVLLRAPLLAGSLFADDWDHYAMSVGLYPAPRNALDRFDFVSGDAGERRALLAAGRLPWWSSRDLELAVLRPLSSALVALDYSWLDAGHVPARAHLHSLLWWLALIGAVAALFYSLLPAPIALVAIALFALHEAHGLPVGWLANRNALVAIAFGALGLRAHVRQRRAGARTSSWWAIAWVALSVLGGEHAFALFGYFVAFELLGMSGAPRERLRALAPFAALGASFLLARGALGYGVSGSGFYIDPLRSPLRYALALAERLPVLLADLVFGLRAEWFAIGVPWLNAWLELASQRHAQIALGYLALGLLLYGLRALARPASSLALEARWLMLGAGLALLPVCITVPMTRLTLGSAIGIDALFALALAGAWRALRAGCFWRRLCAGVLALAIVVVHGVLAALGGRTEVAYFAALSRFEEVAVADAAIDAHALRGRDVFIIAAVSQTLAWALPYVRSLHAQTLPRSATLLSAEQIRPHELTRTGARTLELGVIGAPRAGSYVGSVYRDTGFVAGQRIATPHFQVEVLELREGEPVRLRFEFAHALEDAVFLYPFPEGLRALELPAVGATLRLPGPRL